MTRTFTYSQTKTYTRIELLKSQIRIALRRATNISLEQLDKLEKGIENHWIKKFSVFAVNNQNLCRAELVLEIDWDEYNFQMSRGKATVTIDERWTDDTAIEVHEVINLFNKFVNAYMLDTIWRVFFIDSITSNKTKYQETLEALGLVTCDPIKWAGNKRGGSYQVPELSELSVGCYLQDDD